MGAVHMLVKPSYLGVRNRAHESRSWVARTHLKDKIINESRHLKHKKVIYVAETAHKYKNRTVSL